MRERVLKNYKNYWCKDCGKTHHRQKPIMHCRRCYSRNIIVEGTFKAFKYKWRMRIAKWINKLIKRQSTNLLKG